ncbi:MAG: hypothetical protein U0325_18655 [Polyangiales bacterium]
MSLRPALLAALALALAACATPPTNNGPLPCSASQPCPSGLSCGYAPGCDAVRGVCQRALCATLPVVRTYCGCDGRSFQGGACHPNTPYRAEGACPTP